MTTDETGFEAYARLQGLLRDPSDPLREELSELLLTHTLGWAWSQAQGPAIERPKDLIPLSQFELPPDFNLSKHGLRFCLRCDVPAETLRQLVRVFRQQPDLLLLFVHWRTREFCQELFEMIENGQWPSHMAPDEWVRYEMAGFAGELDQYFEDGHLVWMIDLAKGGLVRRVPAEAQLTYAEAVAADDVAATHLKEAWQTTFSIEPNPAHAFLNAVKAVEAIFKPVISPTNDRATAGSMADNLDQKPDKWRALLPDRRPASMQPEGDIAGVNFLAGTLRLLYQCRRAHGNDQEYDANTLEDAQAACFLASSLMAMQRNGFLTQREEE